MKTIMNILIGIVLLFVILPFIVVYANTHPPRYPLNVPPSIYQAAYEPVSFSTADGIILKGWLVKPAQTAGSFLPRRKGRRSSGLSPARTTAARSQPRAALTRSGWGSSSKKV